MFVCEQQVSILVLRKLSFVCNDCLKIKASFLFFVDVHLIPPSD